MQGPCLNCQERELGCHGKCEKYKGYTDKLEKEREARVEMFNINGYFNDQFKHMRNGNEHKVFKMPKY